MYIPYSGNLLKTFVNFVVLWLFAKVFSAKFGGVAYFGVAKASNLRKKFLSENCIFLPIREIFSLESFPLYGMLYLA